MAVMSKDTVRQMVVGVTNQVWPSVERAIRSKRSDIDETTLSELRSEFERLQLQYMANVMADAPAIYARHLTAQELRDMTAFYRTPPAGTTPAGADRPASPRAARRSACRAGRESRRRRASRPGRSPGRNGRH